MAFASSLERVTGVGQDDAHRAGSNEDGHELSEGLTFAQSAARSPFTLVEAPSEVGRTISVELETIGNEDALCGSDVGVNAENEPFSDLTVHGALGNEPEKEAVAAEDWLGRAPTPRWTLVNELEGALE